MKRHEIEGGEDEAVDAAVEFLAAFIDQDLTQLAELCAPEFSWFGRKIAPGTAGGHASNELDSNASFSLGDVRRIPSPLLEHLADEAAGGPLQSGDAIVLADLALGAVEVTAALVVAEDRTIRRVYDPAALKIALERIGATELKAR